MRNGGGSRPTKARKKACMPTNLENKWVLITGASSGFGAAAACAFGREGCKLLLGARRLDRLATVAADAKKAGSPAAHVHALDVAQTNSVNDFLSWARTHTDRIDVLINNAGGGKGLDPVAQAKDEDWEFMVQTNVLGVLRVTRACLPLMTNNPGSYILNIGSVAGRVAYEGVIPLTDEDIAEALVWAASRPSHVCIDEMLIKCTDQAAIHKVHRRTQGK